MANGDALTLGDQLGSLPSDVIAIQVYDNRVIADWTRREWIKEVEYLKAAGEDVTEDYLEAIYVQAVGDMKDKSLVDV